LSVVLVSLDGEKNEYQQAHVHVQVTVEEMSWRKEDKTKQKLLEKRLEGLKAKGFRTVYIFHLFHFILFPIYLIIYPPSRHVTKHSPPPFTNWSTNLNN